MIPTNRIMVGGKTKKHTEENLWFVKYSDRYCGEKTQSKNQRTQGIYKPIRKIN